MIRIVADAHQSAPRLRRCAGDRHPLTPGSTKALLLGSGELGKEVVIELQRLGIETIGVDRYVDAPAMQVAHRSHVVDMQDADALREVLRLERPDVVIPEIEAIATSVLIRTRNRPGVAAGRGTTRPSDRTHHEP